MAEVVRYAWWQNPNYGLPEDACPVPFRCIEIVPGMDTWVLVHLRHPMNEADLPDGVIAGSRAQKALAESSRA